MKKNVKTSEILRVYNVIGSAKYGKLSDDEKVKVWKIARKLKPIATKFDDASKDAAEKMKPSEDFDDMVAKAQEYERLRQKKEPTIDIMTKYEYDKFCDSFNGYRKLVDKAVKEFADKEVKVDFEPVSEETFGKLMASNDWTMEQAAILGDFITE